MQIEQARALRESLDNAIKAAESSGASEVDLLGNLRAVDDAARAELQAAIDAATPQIDN